MYSTSGSDVADLTVYVWSDGTVQIQPEGNLAHTTTIADLRDIADWAAGLIRAKRAAPELVDAASLEAIDDLEPGSVVIDADGDAWELSAEGRWTLHGGSSIDLDRLTDRELLDYAGPLRIAVPVRKVTS